MTFHVAAIILAAGASSRMGRPKQLLEYQGESLLRRAARTALGAGLSPVFVVMGAVADQIRPSLAELPVEIIENGNWERGMGTSLRAGMAGVMKGAAVPDAVVLMVCDQPRVEAHHIAQIVELHLKNGMPLVAASYDGTCGVPALIGHKYFAELQNIPDDGGARSLFKKFADDLAIIPMPDAAVDVDDADAYRRLSQ